MPSRRPEREPEVEELLDDLHARLRSASEAAELQLLLGLLGALRDRIPPELQRRLGAPLRDLLLALRAAIDWYLARTEPRDVEPVEVRDIPIT